MLLMMVSSSRVAFTVEPFKGFRFNKGQGRQPHWPIPEEEMKAHEENPNSNWRYNFQNDSYCARLELEPFKIPRQITVCFKSNNDMVNGVGLSFFKIVFPCKGY